MGCICDLIKRRNVKLRKNENIPNVNNINASKNIQYQMSANNYNNNNEVVNLNAQSIYKYNNNMDGRVLIGSNIDGMLLDVNRPNANIRTKSKNRGSNEAVIDLTQRTMK